MKNEIIIDESENGLKIKKVDIDGFMIVETQNENTGIYIYNSEYYNFRKAVEEIEKQGWIKESSIHHKGVSV